jgi:hypothetical protein
VAAAVEEHADPVVDATDRDDRLAGHLGGAEVAGTSELAGVRDEEPRLLEHALLLELVDRGIDVAAAVDAFGTGDDAVEDIAHDCFPSFAFSASIPGMGPMARCSRPM